MDEAERLMFEGWATLPQFKRKVDQARSTIREGLAIAPAYVAVSWGKDSTVLLHLCQQEMPGIQAINIGDSLEDLQDNYSEVIKNYCDRFHPNYRQILYDESTDGGFFDIVRQLQSQHPMTFMGCRAQENKHRKIVIKKYGLTHQYQSGKQQGKWRCFPLGWWDWRDVWAYTVVNDLRYLQSYDHPAAGDKSKSRTAVVHNFDLHRGGHQEPVVAQGGMAKLRAIAPEYFAMYADLYPEARAMT